MFPTIEEAKQKIQNLVQHFDEQITTLKNKDYNETQVRRDFIDPFFKALGWDVDNSFGLAESYRDVIHEDRVKVDGKTKAPDYCFTLAGQRKFFVEAKKPSVNIYDDHDPAFQIRRYGWSAKLPISILTDFEEFAIYDCTVKPKLEDKASLARIRYIKYSDYLKDDIFDFIWNHFSKEAALKGKLDAFNKSDKGKKALLPLMQNF